MVNYYKDKQYIPLQITELSEGEAAVALRNAWKRIYKSYPSNKSLALLWAQSALETGRWSIIRNYNFGNIKKRHANPKYKITDDGQLFTMFRCGEIINKKQVMFDPPHIQTHFRAYKTSTDGAEDYIRFVSKKSRYAKAWQEVIKGNPEAYSKELSLAGYYTASVSLYTKGVVRLTNEFNKKAKKLLSWKPTKPVEIESEETFTEEELKEVRVQAAELQLNSIYEYFVNADRTVENDEESDYYDDPKSHKGSTAAVILLFGGILAWLSTLFEGCW